MARGDQADVQAGDGLQGVLRLGPVGQHDVGVVLLGLAEELAAVHLIIEALGGGEVLAEAVVGEEDLVLGAVGDHVVGPVHHGRLNKGERAFADREGVARLHALDLDAEVGAELVHAGRGARVDRGVGGVLLDHRDAARVVHLDVVGDDDLDLGGVNHLADALDELIGKRRLGCIDERDLLIHDEIGVVGDTPLGGVAVERALVPVDTTDPPDIRADLNCVEHGILLGNRANIAHHIIEDAGYSHAPKRFREAQGAAVHDTPDAAPSDVSLRLVRSADSAILRLAAARAVDERVGATFLVLPAPGLDRGLARDAVLDHHIADGLPALETVFHHRELELIGVDAMRLPRVHHRGRSAHRISPGPLTRRCLGKAQGTGERTVTRPGGQHLHRTATRLRVVGLPAVCTRHLRPFSRSQWVSL